jgi:hypothetical protein
VSVLNPLRLELGERWLFVTRADGSVLYDDVRRAAQDRAREVNMDLWKASPSQKVFANVAVLDLCSQMLSDPDVMSDRMFVKFLLCVTSNTLQYVWVDSAAAGDKVQQRCCGDCRDVILDVHHVFECSAKETTRKEWCTDLIEYLKRFVPVSTVTYLSGALSWNELITCMFGVASDSSTLLRLMFGGFGALEAYHMLSRLNVVNRVFVKQMTLELRKRMFDQMYVLWRQMCV